MKHPPHRPPQAHLQVEALEARCLLDGSGKSVALPASLLDRLGPGAPQPRKPLVDIAIGLETAGAAPAAISAGVPTTGGFQDLTAIPSSSRFVLAAASPLDVVKPTSAQIIKALEKLLASMNERKTSVDGVLKTLNDTLSKLKPGDRDFFDTVARIKRYEGSRDQLASDISQLTAILKELKDGKITAEAAMNRLGRVQLAWHNDLEKLEAEIKKIDDQLAKKKPTDAGYFDLLLKKEGLTGKRLYLLNDLIALVDAVTKLITGQPP
jgi:hypothetical protein